MLNGEQDFRIALKEANTNKDFKEFSLSDLVRVWDSLFLLRWTSHPLFLIFSFLIINVVSHPKKKDRKQKEQYT